MPSEPLSNSSRTSRKPHFGTSLGCSIDGNSEWSICIQAASSWHHEGGLFFGWIGRPRILDAGYSARPHQFGALLAREWARKGAPALAEIRGSWAMMIHDPKARKLVMATDRFATVPILYRFLPDGEGLVISTELRELQQHDPTPLRINRQAALQFLTLRHVADRQHLVEGVHRILPGTAIKVYYEEQPIRIAETRYCASEPRPSQDAWESENEHVAVAQIRQAIAEELEDGWAFHKRCNSSQVGLLYSGGLDSAFLAANLNEPQCEQLHSITFGFDRKTADIAFARASVGKIRHLADRWTPLQIRPEQTPELLDRIIQETSLPVEHPNFLARRQSYQHLADQGMGTIVAGEGADTLLGGSWYVTMQKVLRARQLADRFSIPRMVWSLAGHLNRSRRDLFRLVGEPDWRMVCVLAKAYVPFSWLSVTANSLGPWSAGSFPYHTGILDRVGPKAKLEAIYELGLMANMSAELAAEQAMARRCGMSQWNPYLDGLFPDRVASIPLSLRTKDWQAKYLLYKAAQGNVPDVCLNRPKSGCPAPLVAWLSDKNALGEYVQATGDPHSFCSELLGSKVVGDVVERFHAKPNAQGAEILWVLVNLERWADLVLKALPPKPMKAVQHV